MILLIFSRWSLLANAETLTIPILYWHYLFISVDTTRIDEQCIDREFASRSDKVSCISFNSCLLELAISYTDIKMRVETVLSINWPSRCRTEVYDCCCYYDYWSYTPIVTWIIVMMAVLVMKSVSPGASPANAVPPWSMRVGREVNGLFSFCTVAVIIVSSACHLHWGLPVTMTSTPPS